MRHTLIGWPRKQFWGWQWQNQKRSFRGKGGSRIRAHGGTRRAGQNTARICGRAGMEHWLGCDYPLHALGWTRVWVWPHASFGLARMGETRAVYGARAAGL